MGARSWVRSSQESQVSPGRQQVAAVCYRMRKSGIDFLLVQTRSGRWIFPKGGAESGLSHAQSAALEAFEEAGVHGRIEAVPFARYFRRRPELAAEGNPEQAAVERPELAVIAFLCEVSRLELPQERYRNPSWFSPEKAKLYLRKKRAPAFGAELARIIDRAAARIRRVREGASPKVTQAHPRYGSRDRLQEVPFEAGEIVRVHGSFLPAAYAQRPRSQNLPRSHSVGRGFIAATPFCSQVRLRLGSGLPAASEAPRKVQSIDEGRGPAGARSLAKPAKKRSK